ASGGPAGPPPFPPPVGPPAAPPAGPPRGPAGPPPGGYGYGYQPPGGPTPPPKPSKTGLIVGIAVGVVVLLVAVTVGVLVLTQDDAEAGEVFLAPATEIGDDPFTDSVANPRNRSVASQGTTGTSAGGPLEVRSAAGSQPGLYGGTQNQAQCDRRQMIDFLQANPEKGRAWAGVQGIGFDQLEDYILDLTSMQLRTDTRVTNHGFRDGRATSFQAVLQAGTAVLVDRQGIPRARCACGNPLTPPTAVTARPTFRGPQWTGFSASSLTVIQIDVTIDIFVITDIDTGDPFTRPPGTDGDDDQPGDGTDDDTDTTLPPDTRPPDTLPPDDFDDFTGDYDVDIILTWGGNDDLDLHVIEPSGEELYFGASTTSTGGTLVGGDEVPGCEDVGAHGEEAFWGPDQAVPGTYQVFVRNFGACDDDGANYDLQVTVNGEFVAGDTGVLTPGTDSATITFEVPG
ncbi:MAG TPA: hypothetical protein PKA98_17625, partial [Acidimicrobiales bacterium]|nr:hypothetical protein [Acidimicrobiales bacterium]